MSIKKKEKSFPCCRMNLKYYKPQWEVNYTRHGLRVNKPIKKLVGDQKSIKHEGSAGDSGWPLKWCDFDLLSASPHGIKLVWLNINNKPIFTVLVYLLFSRGGLITVTPKLKLDTSRDSLSARRACRSRPLSAHLYNSSKNHKTQWHQE